SPAQPQTRLPVDVRHPAAAQDKNVLGERIGGIRNGNHIGGRSHKMRTANETGRIRRLVGVVTIALVLATGALGSTAGSTTASPVNVDRFDQGGAVVASDPVHDLRPVAIRRYLHPRIGFTAE